jgi:glycosyltransferase involved in cell wall biosynthesis
MRICLYTETALPKLGGQEGVVDALARQFGRLGHEVVVLAPHPRRPRRTGDADLPYPVMRHPRFLSSRYMVAWYRRWLLRLHRTWGFDLLHCHGLYPSGYLAGLCRDQLRVPIVLTSHGGDVYEGNHRLADPRLRRRYQQALEAADALIAISRFTRDGFTRLCPHARQIVSIPNGVDLEPFAQPAPRPADLDPAIRTGMYALFLGRLKKRKGVDVLLQALALAPSTGHVQLVIAGDGEERPALEAQMARLDLARRVRFVGKATGGTKSYLLQNALCVAMPSRNWEAFPLVVVESYAAGTPVIASRIPGLEDLVQPERTGWLVPSESSDDLAGALRRVFADPARAGRLGEAAREVAGAYSWQAVARQHLRLFDELRDAGAVCRAG